MDLQEEDEGTQLPIAGVSRGCMGGGGFALSYVPLTTLDSLTLEHVLGQLMLQKRSILDCCLCQDSCGILPLASSLLALGLFSLWTERRIMFSLWTVGHIMFSLWTVGHIMFSLWTVGHMMAPERRFTPL